MKTKQGFTLIELLVVIAIIGLLSSVVLASLNSARAKARDAQRLSSLKSIATAIELYKSDTGNAPAYGSGTTSYGEITPSTILNVLVTGNYMSAIPTDPVNTGTFKYRYCNRSTTNTSGYCNADSSSKTFSIRFQTETTTSLGAAGYYCLTSNGFTTTSGTCTQR